MHSFSEVLLSNQVSAGIPDDQNLFGQFVGGWDFDWYDRMGRHAGRHVKGEWIFSWILEGSAIQDVFICPSRTERLTNHQADSEYGTTIRIFNPKSSAWDIFYGCTNEAVCLEARKEKDEIVLTEISSKNMKWIFSEITGVSFHWRHIRTEDGSKWDVYGELFATRRRENYN